MEKEVQAAFRNGALDPISVPRALSRDVPGLAIQI